MHETKIVQYSPENATEDDLIQFYKENKEKYEGMTLYLGAEGDFVEYFVPYTEQELIDNTIRLIGYYLEDLESNRFFKREKLGDLSPSTFNDAITLHLKLKNLYSKLFLLEDYYKMDVILYKDKKEEILEKYEGIAQKHYDSILN